MDGGWDLNPLLVFTGLYYLLLRKLNGFIVIHLVSVTFDLLPIPGVLYEQMR